MNVRPDRRLVIVVRADPVICGHSGEARNLAEAALHRGFDDVRILSWPIERLQATGLPLKPLDSILPYSPGITVERPDPVGDYKVPDGRYLAGLTGRLVELFTDGVPTVCLSLYLSPHTVAVTDAVRAARDTGLPMDVVTLAEAVGSDVTNVVRSCVESGRYGAAAHLLSSYLAQDHCLAVSEYTREMIIEEAALLDLQHGTTFAARCRERIGISYPAIDTSAFLDLDPAETRSRLAGRGLEPGGYVLFLSRLSSAKGVEDLIAGYAASRAKARVQLVIAGRGPAEEELRRVAAQSPLADRIHFLTDVDDAEKPHLMAGSAAYVLASKPQKDFIETFGIALTESMLAGGGPVVTTDVGGILEAVGPWAAIVPHSDPAAITAAIDHAIYDMTDEQRFQLAAHARDHALQFDRLAIFDRMMARLEVPQSVQAPA
ncbi:Glycosyltransferase involved in cell wall bisynthesis [Raineyella antarctica]|uniref:Glycosyltransferase involved in cell wall bisynthesis n=1 Tax=Raineyella antarctica TaxID=1577474 RepID=A0A1G6GNU8_9ACTN|nr:glycosyltransferase [Raineyella antarctica]SDB83425.1 Glycosyltransferase involved in cell wall bisynthesis [Raineyella antarctica]